MRRKKVTPELPALPKKLNGKAILPHTPFSGNVLTAVNLSPDMKGVLERCHEHYECGAVEHRPIACDRRNGRIYILCQEDDGTICCAGHIDSKYNYHADYQELGRVTAKITDGAGISDFVVLLSERGELTYLRYDKERESYTFLGGLPELPAISVSIEEGPQISEETESVTFKTPIDDPRKGIDEETRERVSKVVTDTYNKAVEGAHEGGYFTQPIYMRMAMRLWDGKAIQISAPVKIAPPYSTRPTERINLPLQWDSTKKVFTGAGEGKVTVRPYRPVIHAAGGIPEEWRELIPGIEIWITQEPEALSGESAAGVWAHYDTTGNYLTALLPVKSEQQLLEELEELPMCMAAAPMETVNELRISYRADYVYNSAIMEYEVSSPAMTGITCLLGYADFLHLGRGSDLITMHRSNPFAEADRTMNVGGEISAIRPQIKGGGAYTRQYLYLATQKGIAALTYKHDGRHTNCRMVTQDIPQSADTFLPTPEGVYTFTESGALISISDARCTTILHDTKGIRHLAWSNRRGELWLRGDAEFGSIVLTDRRKLNFYHCTAPAEQPLPLLNPALYISKEHNGVYIIKTLDHDDVDLMEKVSYRAILPVSRRINDCMGLIGVGLYGEDVNVTVNIIGLEARYHYMKDPEKLLGVAPIYDAYIMGTGPVVYDLPLGYPGYPIRDVASRQWLVDITGRFDSISELELSIPVLK